VIDFASVSLASKKSGGRRYSKMAWYNKHRVLTGAILGFTAGSVVPGLGNLVGAVAGAIVAPMIIEEETKDK
jgi:uncharacterized protein YqgC (DUF456 family)